MADNVDRAKRCRIFRLDRAGDPPYANSKVDLNSAANTCIGVDARGSFTLRDKPNEKLPIPMMISWLRFTQAGLQRHKSAQRPLHQGFRQSSGQTPTTCCADEGVLEQHCVANQSYCESF